MKNIFLLLISCIAYSSLFAQNKPLDYYVGTWKWVDSSTNSEITIRLELATGVWPGNVTYSFLKGGYIYKKNGVIVADYMNELDDNKNYVLYPISIVGKGRKFRIRDYIITNNYGKKKLLSGSSYLKYYSSNPEKIHWKLYDDAQSGDIITDDARIYPPGISLPSDIILTKIE